MKRISFLLWILIIPLLLLLEATGEYRIISAAIVVLALLPFFLRFEGSRPRALEIVLIAVLTALNVALRILFSPLPFFKPVTALIILSALVFGSETGFLIGALSALLSNFYFGQGIWTPWQMFAWGLVGALSGTAKGILDFEKPLLYICMILLGIFSAFLYAGIMDLQTVFFIENRFHLPRFLAVAGASFIFTLVHMAANVVFLTVFGGAVLRIFKRIQSKYI